MVIQDNTVLEGKLPHFAEGKLPPTRLPSVHMVLQVVRLNGAVGGRPPLIPPCRLRAVACEKVAVDLRTESVTGKEVRKRETQRRFDEANPLASRCGLPCGESRRRHRGYTGHAADPRKIQGTLRRRGAGVDGGGAYQ